MTLYITYKEKAEKHLCSGALSPQYHISGQEIETQPTVVLLNESLRKYAMLGANNYMQNTLLDREGADKQTVNKQEMGAHRTHES